MFVFLARTTPTTHQIECVGDFVKPREWFELGKLSARWHQSTFNMTKWPPKQINFSKRIKK